VLGQPEFIHRSHLRIDDTKDEVDSESLANDAGAEPPEFCGVGEIGITPFLEVLALQVRQESRQRGSILGAQDRSIRPDWPEGAMQTPDRGGIDTEVNIRRAGLLRDGKVFVNVREGLGNCSGLGAFCGHAADDDELFYAPANQP
jgi:hypothetical protein